MYTRKLLLTVATGSLVNVGCFKSRLAPLGTDQDNRSILASIGEIGTPPNGLQLSDLEFRLYCDNDKDGIKGKVTDLDQNAIFTPKSDKPISVGSKCTLRVIGPDSDKLIFKNEPLNDGRRYYNLTDTAELTAKRTLELHSINQYIVKGDPLFKVSLKVTNQTADSLTLDKNSIANLKCQKENLTLQTEFDGTDSFIFQMVTGHFTTVDQINCDELTVTSKNDKELVYATKDTISLELSSKSQDIQKDIELEKKVDDQTTTTDGRTDISVSISNLTGTYQRCYFSGSAYKLETIKIEENSGAHALSYSASKYEGIACTGRQLASEADKKYSLDFVDLINPDSTDRIKINLSNNEEAIYTILSPSEEGIILGEVSTNEDIFTGSTQEDQRPTELSTSSYKRK
ncbi:MAG: hypothetical protein R3B45_03675 [Bdellovibrionota bacterium]